jgi:hypothetical protein
MSAGKPAPFLDLKQSDLHAVPAHAVTRSFAGNAAVVTQGDRSNSLAKSPELAFELIGKLICRATIERESNEQA